MVAQSLESNAGGHNGVTLAVNVNWDGAQKRITITRSKPSEEPQTVVIGSESKEEAPKAAEKPPAPPAEEGPAPEEEKEVVVEGVPLEEEPKKNPPEKTSKIETPDDPVSFYNLFTYAAGIGALRVTLLSSEPEEEALTWPKRAFHSMGFGAAGFIPEEEGEEELEQKTA